MCQTPTLLFVKFHAFAYHNFKKLLFSNRLFWLPEANRLFWYISGHSKQSSSAISSSSHHWLNSNCLPKRCDWKCWWSHTGLKVIILYSLSLSLKFSSKYYEKEVMPYCFLLLQFLDGITHIFINLCLKGDFYVLDEDQVPAFSFSSHMLFP